VRHYKCFLGILSNRLHKGQADIILANSKFTARVFKSYFPSISQNPDIVYPGINIQAYTSNVDTSNTDVSTILSFVLFSFFFVGLQRLMRARPTPTLLSLNRFEKKKNAALAVEAFAILKTREPSQTLRLVLAGKKCVTYHVSLR
jgi:alpha-1,3/alpha-1,6-mannosyltransferase